MKKILFIIVAALSFSTLMASQPTVTRTKIARTNTHDIWKFTFATAIADADSVFIGGTGTAGNDDDSYFDLRDFGGHNAKSDSTVSVWFSSSEGTADSTRFTVLHQFSYNYSSTASATADFITADTDATSLTNTSTAVVGYRPERAGWPGKYRMIVYENDSSKDATQTITMYVAVPRER